MINKGKMVFAQLMDDTHWGISAQVPLMDWE